MTTETSSTVPDVPFGVVPYLAVGDGRGALAWYADALGAREVGERHVMPDGSIGHAAMHVQGATFYLAEGAYIEGNVAPPRPGSPVPVSLVLTVSDCDAVVAHAVAAGARLERQPADNPYGRIGVVVDPHGHRWMLEGPVTARVTAPGATPRAEVEPPRAGDLAYAAWWTPDVDRATAFYGTVLGWQVAPGSAPQGRQVTSTTLPTGLWGRQVEHTLFCCWLVDDVDEASDRVREAGGTAGAAHDEPYGRIADCVDPQGLAFALFAPPADADPGTRTPLNGVHHGDLTYLTLELADRDAGVQFYAEVLGWPSDADDAESVHPMLGVAGGRDPARVVPCWKVDDVPAAVERVLAAGGTAGEPAPRPYGVLADCVDDQGARFYLSDA